MRTLLTGLVCCLVAAMPLTSCAQNASDQVAATDATVNPEIEAYLGLLSARFVDDWRRFRQRYILPDGRVIDTGNGGVSHSEGQGYAMLFAVAADDPATFEQLRLWTTTTLQRDDGLHFWRYDPRAEPRISDINSAADGELLISWALLRAAALWQNDAYRAQALNTIQTFEDRLIRRIGRHLVIIPWDGADLDSPLVVNPSYFVFPAMQDIAVAVGSRLWIQLYEDCLDLLQSARFGQWKLPPDWLAIDENNDLAPWRERNPYFSYDAIRIPLHLVWAGHDSPEFLDTYLRAWDGIPIQKTPAWFNLLPGSGHHAQDAAPEGVRTVRLLTENMSQLANETDGELTQLPSVYRAEDYYSASLILLSRLAEIDWWRASIRNATQVPQSSE